MYMRHSTYSVYTCTCTYVILHIMYIHVHVHVMYTNKRIRTGMINQLIIDTENSYNYRL